MNTRSLFSCFGLTVAALLVLTGCASTPKPAGSDRQFNAEISMVEEQSEQIIADVQRNRKGGDRIIPNDELTIEVWMRDQKTQFEGIPFQQDRSRVRRGVHTPNRVDHGHREDG